MAISHCFSGILPSLSGTPNVILARNAAVPGVEEQADSGQ